MILLFWTFYFFTLYNIKEPFRSRYDGKINKIQRKIKQLQAGYVDIQSQVMRNYHFECPPDEPTSTPIPKSKVLSDEDRLQKLQNDFYSMESIEEDKKKPQKMKTKKPLMAKTKRLDYDKIVRDFIESDDGLDDIRYIPQKIKEQKKLENYLKCYNNHETKQS